VLSLLLGKESTNQLAEHSNDTIIILFRSLYSLPPLYPQPLHTAYEKNQCTRMTLAVILLYDRTEWFDLFLRERLVTGDLAIYSRPQKSTKH